MDVKKYLSQINTTQKAIDGKRERLKRLEALLLSPDISHLSLNTVQGTRATDRQEALTVEKVQLENELTTLIYKQAENIIRIGKQIDNIQDCNLSRLLTLRYITGLSLKDIAQRMKKSHAYIRQLHPQALKAFQSQYKHEIDT